MERRALPRLDPERRAHRDVVYTLARASEVDDEDTGNHLARIQQVVERFALAMGFTLVEAGDLGFDAMLHDVGKMKIPHHILKKPDALTEEERRIMQSHTVLGERMLSGRPAMQRAACIARSHHEAWDGSGYPDGLAGEDIPIEARITAAADVLDALIADRCYKEGWPYDRAVRQIHVLSGTQLDPNVVDALSVCDATGALKKIFRPSAYTQTL